MPAAYPKPPSDPSYPLDLDQRTVDALRELAAALAASDSSVYTATVTAYDGMIRVQGDGSVSGPATVRGSELGLDPKMWTTELRDGIEYTACQPASIPTRAAQDDLVVSP